MMADDRTLLTRPDRVTSQDMNFRPQFHKSGTTGLAMTVAGGLMMAFAFYEAFKVFGYYGSQQAALGGQFTNTLNLLLQASIQVMFLGVMGWIGSIFLLRGVDFMKVDRGIGILTFKVEKGVGVVTGLENPEQGGGTISPSLPGSFSSSPSRASNSPREIPLRSFGKD
jgi:hypothetical protein